MKTPRLIFGRLMAAFAFALAAAMPAHAGLSGSGGIELAGTVVTGTFVGTTSSASTQIFGMGNVTLTGTFSATVVIERSFDGGATFTALPLDTAGTANAYTAPVTLVINEAEAGVFYRVRCSAYTSGTVTYRISAGSRNQ